nr:MAG: internal scaffolding protein [Microvirus sp.]
MSKAAVVFPVVHSAFNPPADPGVDCSVMPSMTQQNFRDECDINNIMARYQSTGLLDVNLTQERGVFTDVANAVDYHTAQNIILQAREVFSELPAKIRKRFNDDPGLLLAFLDDSSNRDEAIALGLVKAPEKAADAAAAGTPGIPRAAAAATAAAPGDVSKGDLKGA